MVSKPRSSTGSRLWRRLPVGLLVLVALVQIVAVFEKDLNPWKGGGFGMFATVDSPAVRRLEVVAIGPGFSEALEVSDISIASRRRAMTYPSSAHLEDVAVRTWPDWPSGTRVVQVAVWSLEGDPHLPRLRRTLLGRRAFRILGGPEAYPP